MATSKLQELETLFDDHPSLDASLQDFEHGSSSIGRTSPTPRFMLPPHHHSRSRSDSASENSRSPRSLSRSRSPLAPSDGRYSPPAWRRDRDGHRSSGFWGRVGRGLNSRESSPAFESADEGEEEEDETLAAALRTRLPTGSLSPEKQGTPAPEGFGAVDEFDVFGNGKGESTNNYIRFAVRAEVQHRTEPFEAAYYFMKSRFDGITRSWTSLGFSVVVALISILSLRTLFQPASPQPVPDLVKVAGLAKAFEPLIFYSENGVQQIGDLQATGIAVWDLGESVRSTNMTSAPIIVKELDDLSESLKTLALELTRFFANVDGDVDGILIVMDWAKRELSQLLTRPPSPITSVFDNVHAMLSRWGLFERPTGAPTAIGHLTTSVFGMTSPQRTRATLQRTFTEFLTILEEAINSELQHSLAIFSLFESIDRQFLNLARTVIRESSAQDSAQDDMLSSLWAKILGPNANTLQKFEKNRKLLGSIRAKTVQNKSILLEHNGKLLTLKANLESLRRKLVSPLLRANGSTLGVEEQIRGLEEVGGYLGGVRERQRGKLMEMLYGAGSSSGRRIAGADGKWE